MNADHKHGTHLQCLLGIIYILYVHNMRLISNYMQIVACLLILRTLISASLNNVLPTIAVRLGYIDL